MPQAELINKHFGACRFIYNLALETKSYAYASHRKNLTFFDLDKQLTELRKDCVWMQEISHQSLESSLENLDKAFTNFFKRNNNFPKFKSKSEGFQSFQARRKSKIKGNKIFLTKFREGINIVLHRKFEGEIKTVTISRTPTGKYFASVLVDNKKELPSKKHVIENTTTGIDLGIKSFMVTSDGIKVDNPKHLQKALLHLKYLQRQASKKKKGSSNRKRANFKVALCHEKIANSRKDFLHKLSTNLIKSHDTICLEDLNIAGMRKNHSLALSISDVGWGMFVQMCKYKAEWCGKNILQIPTFEPSTKLCSNCGTINHTLTLADREWICTNCETLHDRDINAAINIKNYCVGTQREKLAELLSIDKAVKQEVITI